MVKLFNYSFPYNYLEGAKMGQGRVGCSSIIIYIKQIVNVMSFVKYRYALLQNYMG